MSLSTWLAALPRWVAGPRDPLSRLPGMTTLEERRFCHDFARDQFTGRGEIVDLGCWLGATTAALASGLTANGRPETANKAVHAFDAFVWQPYMAPHAKRLRLLPGDDFQNEFEHHVHPWRDRVRVVATDLAQITWGGGPIEFLFIDVMKDWPLADAVVRQFYPALLPGSLVVHQDFAHAFTPWIHLIQYRLRDFFEPVLDVPNSCSLVFRARRPVPMVGPASRAGLADSAARLAAPTFGFDSLTVEEVLDAFAWSRTLVGADKQPRVAAAEAMAFHGLGRLDLARLTLRRFASAEARRDPDFASVERLLAHEPAPVIPHGEVGVRVAGHRDYVGGLWDGLGRLQFDFLLRQGLKPHHVFLDVGCGCLRGGVHFIPYLEPGHYLGLDKEPGLIEAGLNQELAAEIRAAKKPRLLVSEDFAFADFGTPVDFALAQSLFTHLPTSAVRTCLERLRPCMRPEGVFFATFFEADRPVNNPATPHDHGYFAYTRGELEALGSCTGWETRYLGAWGHPRGQVMMQFRPRRDRGDRQ